MPKNDVERSETTESDQWHNKTYTEHMEDYKESLSDEFEYIVDKENISSKMFHIFIFTLKLFIFL